MAHKGVYIDERRRFQRVPHLLGASLVAPGYEDVPLFVVDLSAGGVHAAAHIRLPMDSVWVLRIQGEDGSLRLEGLAKVAWQRETSLSGSFHFGLEFLYEESRQRAAEIVAELDAPVGLGETPSFRGLSPSELDRLSVLGRICRILNRGMGSDYLLHQLTLVLKEAFDIERAMVMIRQEDDSLKVVSYNGGTEGVDEVAYSRLVTGKVLAEGESLLSLDAQDDRNLGPSQSISLLGTRSVMCVPLRDDERLFGLLYVDNTMVAAAFSRADLEMVTIMADLAATAIERAEIQSILRENERELITAKRAAEAADLAKTNFLANVSHEIRTPMNGVLGMTRQLIGTPLSSDQERCLSVVASSAEHLLEIINALLDYSRMEAGELCLSEGPVDLAEVMETSLRTVMARSGRADLEVVTRMDPTLPPRILGDRERLRQVLLKLVDNAVKFTHRGGRVELLAARLGDRVRFEVRDTGVGISGEKLDLVFEPFTQADNSSTRSYGGMGMGLALCQGLIALMGGELTVESKVGHGSVFRFDVPVRAALSLEPFQRVYQAADIRPLRILLVEDNVVNQVVAEGLLSEWGHQVTMAEHGQAALRLLTREHEFDLVFMDLQMPVMDGLQATLELRLRERNWERPVVPVVALTAHGTSQDEESCRLAGMNGFLRKPVVAADFLQCLGGLFASD